MIFKINFEKAFDTLDHEAILQVLTAKGFPSIFIKWVKEILTSRYSSVLLNGIPGKTFVCKIVLPAKPRDLMVFKEILEMYAAFTGLKINFHKSSLVSIKVP